MKERWKDVPGFEGRYQVSDAGRVRSVDRMREVRTRWGGTFFRAFRGQMLTPVLDGDGYLRVGLYDSPRSLFVPVHRLVALTFVPNIFNLPAVDHKDSDRANPAASNLQWVTGSQNTALSASRGKMLKGEQHPHAKLTEDNVRNARRLAAEGVPFMELARKFCVTDVAVRSAVLRVTWRHVE